MSFITNKTKTQPIEVGILEISSQNRAILEFFFSDAGKSSFKEVSADKAEAFIIDYDSLGAKDSWESTFAETQKPGIIISIKEVDLPSTVWLQKPLTVKSLTEAGKSIREMMVNDVIASEPEKTEKVEEEAAEIEDVIEADLEVKSTNKDISVEEELVIQEMVEESVEVEAELEPKATEKAAQEDNEFVDLIDFSEETTDQAEAPIEEILDIVDIADNGEKVKLEDIVEAQGDQTIVWEETQEASVDFDEGFIDLIQETDEATPQEENIEQEDAKAEIVLEPEREQSADLVDELVEERQPEENLLDFGSLETVEEQADEIKEVEALTAEPELAMADTLDSASSTAYAVAPDIIDVDLKLDDDEEVNSDNQKSSTTPIDAKKVEETTSTIDEKEEVDSLLESLISGEGSGKRSKPAKEIVEEPSDFLDLDIETIEVAEEKPEKQTAEIADFSLPVAEKIEDESLSLDMKVNALDAQELETAETSNNNLNTVAKLVTGAALSKTAASPDLKVVDTPAPPVDDDTIEQILRSGEKTKKAKKANKSAKREKTAEEELQSLLEEIRQEADGTDGSGQSQASTKYEATNAEERWKLVCGEHSITDLKKIKYFNPSNHWLAALIQNINAAKQSNDITRMKFNGIIIVIDPETDRIYCDQDVSTEFFANICYEPMPQEKIKVHNLDESEIRLYRKKMKEDENSTHYSEFFIWTVSLLTSRGRLPKGTNIKAKLGLKAWPDLTRVENIPHMMQIAALFHKNTWSLLDLTKKSDIQMNYIVGFYNAVLALDIIQTNGEATSVAAPNLKAGKNKNRSFFSKLLKKIKA